MAERRFFCQGRARTLFFYFSGRRMMYTAYNTHPIIAPATDTFSRAWPVISLTTAFPFKTPKNAGHAVVPIAAAVTTPIASHKRKRICISAPLRDYFPMISDSLRSSCRFNWLFWSVSSRSKIVVDAAGLLLYFALTSSRDTLPFPSASSC